MSRIALIIDDNPSNLDVLEQLLKRENIETVSVMYPYELPDVLKNVPQVDVVFLDLEFPNDNGLNLISEYHSHPALTSAPFVAYTVHVSEQNEARAAGFHSFLGKPLDVEQFPELLQRILNGERVWEIAD